MLYLYGRGPGTGHVAEKIACGYFLLLRNKKQLILMAPFLAAVAATETHGRKNSLWLFFIIPPRGGRSKGAHCRHFVDCAFARGPV